MDILVLEGFWRSLTLQSPTLGITHHGDFSSGGILAQPHPSSTYRRLPTVQPIQSHLQG